MHIQPTRPSFGRIIQEYSYQNNKQRTKVQLDAVKSAYVNSAFLNGAPVGMVHSGTNISGLYFVVDGDTLTQAYKNNYPVTLVQADNIEAKNKQTENNPNTARDVLSQPHITTL